MMRAHQRKFAGNLGFQLPGYRRAKLPRRLGKVQQRLRRPNAPPREKA